MREKPVVYFGSVRTPELKPEYSIAGKYLKIIDELGIKDVVKGKRVVIKMHVGKNLGFSTIHPLLVRLLVHEIKKHGGYPYIVDIPEQVVEAYARGYTHEVIGCPILPVAGVADNYYIEKVINYRGLRSLKLGGNCKDGEVLIVLSHVKGHNTAGFGGAIKNIALGCFTRDTRWGMHKCTQLPEYWFPDKYNGNVKELMKRLVEICPRNAIKVERGRIRVVFDLCNQCMRCVKIAKGALVIRQDNFNGFFEVMAMAAKFVLEQFDEDKRFFINIALDMTEVCDCWGFTTGNILPDLGVLGSTDILAIDKATLDLTDNLPLIKENVSQTTEIIDNPELHPFARIHGPFKDPYLQIYFGEKYNLGSIDYEIVEVYPIRKERVRKELMPPSFPKVKRIYPKIKYEL